MTDPVVARLAEWEAAADLDTRAGAPVGEALRAAVGLLRSVLELKPSMHGDHEPIPDTCKRCEGEAYGLTTVRERITNWLTHYDDTTPLDDEENQPDA